jgi:hypothetical protein
MPVQTLPQVPQLVRSVMRLTQAPEHRERPALHWHWLFTQSRVESQALPQRPQWVGFAARFSQPLPQSAVPKAHSHVPPAHCVPFVQTVVQLPQCCSSDRVLKHPSGHRT